MSELSHLGIGTGLDVHAFCEDRPLVLGGVSIADGPGLLGHSDADVLTHAVMDALLSAARLGDIGELFPDTASEYEGISSLVLLEQVRRELEKAGVSVVDIDCTIAAETPKLAPYKEEIRRTLAGALGISKACIGLKATTCEGLGFIGKKKGMAAFASVLVRKGA